jgi:hypothetical protein
VTQALWGIAKAPKGRGISGENRLSTPAIAREFLGVIYKTSKHNWTFEGFPRFVLANG